jgi:hypothetical protein
MLLPSIEWSGPKQGFVLPIADWLTKDLAPEIASLLADERAVSAALLEPSAVLREWRAFSDGNATWLRPWALYALVRWHSCLTAGSDG